MYKHHCSNCGRATARGYGKKGYRSYICENGNLVDHSGICDRYIAKVQNKEFYKRIDESIKRMEPFQEGTYEIRKLPPLGTNYRVLK